MSAAGPGGGNEYLLDSLHFDAPVYNTGLPMAIQYLLASKLELFDTTPVKT